MLYRHRQIYIYPTYTHTRMHTHTHTHTHIHTHTHTYTHTTRMHTHTHKCTDTNTIQTVGAKDDDTQLKCSEKRNVLSLFLFFLRKGDDNFSFPLRQGMSLSLHFKNSVTLIMWPLPERPNRGADVFSN